MASRTAKSQRKKLAPKPSATLVVASQVGSLDKAQRALLSEALRRAEQTRNVVEDALLDFGRWLLVYVFADDAAAALDARRENPLWRELLSRAGGSSLRLSVRFLHVSVAIAAHDKRIQDETWRLLEPGRKELLLPLADETLMRKAAQQVVAMKMSQRATRDYVREVRASRGEVARVRAIAVPRFRAQLKKLRERVTTPTFQRGVERGFGKLGTGERAELQRELEGLRQWTSALLGKLRATGGK